MSSTPNKRLNEEGGTGGGSHAHLSAKYQHEDSTSFPGIGSKMMSVSGEDHVPYQAGQESRLPKFPRTESREGDRRPPLLPVFRMSSSSNPSNPDHPVGSESRLDSRDSKDFNRDSKFEHRESKVESRDLYQVSKAADVKFENRVEDSKDSKDGCFEHKGDLRTDKDVYVGAATHSSWKDMNEQLRGKHYSDASGGNVDSWHPSRSKLHVSVEGGKDAAHIKKDYVEAREAVGENKVDVRGDDKFKDKDRKKKEAKHREWGERDKDKNDRRYDGENKDIIKDERETERWEKERKDLFKDKEKTKDGDKDYVKKEAGTGAEKGSFRCDKDLPDIPGRGAEVENSVTEIKKFKDGDGWRIGDKDPGDRKKDRDIDAEGESMDKRNRHHDKKSDDGGPDAEGSAEKEKEGPSYGLQQRKRMLRPRGSPQHTNSNHAFMPRSHDNEGSQGKADISAVMYKVGECMQELIKLWKEYESSQADRMSDVSLGGPTLDIWVPAEHVSATNRQVRGGQLWGTDVYTDDSDLVAVLMHTGYCRPTASPPPATIQELRVTIRVLPPQDSYISTLRNNVRSRAWGSGIGCSYRVDRCCIVKKEGGIINLEPCLTHSSTLEPTLAPVAVERTMTTRAAASNAQRQQRFVREVTIQFNLCCEPWLKYSISVVADKGLKKANYTSSRLKKGEVLYLETHSRRYELCFNGEKMVKTSTTSLSHEAEVDKSHNYSQNANGERGAVDGESAMTDVFRWSRCKKPLPQRMMKSIGIPLPAEHVEVLEDNLEWEDIRWSSTSVHINGKEYALARAHFLSLH